MPAKKVRVHAAPMQSPIVAPTPGATSAAVPPATTPSQVTQPVTASGTVPVAIPPIATSSSTSTTANGPALSNVASPVPNVQIPVPTAGFAAPDPSEFLGYRPSTRELSASTAALTDLGSFATYGVVLGTGAPNVQAVTSALQLAIQWRVLKNSTATWDSYVRAQDGLAWKDALILLDRVKVVFLNAVLTNPALADQYPGLADFFNAPKIAAKQAAATKKKAKATAVKAAAAGTGATSVPSPSTPTAPVTPAPVKSTVTGS